MRYQFPNKDRDTLVCTLMAGETLSANAASVESTDDAVKAKGLGGGLSAFFGRVASGERGFDSTFSTKTGGKITLKAEPGFKIRAIEVDGDNILVAEMQSILAVGPGLEWETIIVHKVKPDVYGKQGFRMQRIKGTGTAFVVARGTCAEHKIYENKVLTTDLTSFVGLQNNVKYDMSHSGTDFKISLDGRGTVYLQDPAPEE